MKLPIDPDLLVEALTTPSSSFVGDEGCPESEKIWETVCGRVARADLAKVIDHAVDCPICAHDLRAAREMAEELREIEPVSESGTMLGAFWARFRAFGAALELGGMGIFRWIGVELSGRGEYLIVRSPVAITSALAASAVVLVLFLNPRFLNPRDKAWPGQGQERSPASPVLRLLIPEGQSLPRESFVLRWQGLEGALYDVRLMTTDLDEVKWASHLSDPEFRVDPEDLTGIAPSTTLLWQVEAFLPDGSRLYSSTFRIRLK